MSDYSFHCDFESRAWSRLKVHSLARKQKNRKKKVHLKAIQELSFLSHNLSQQMDEKFMKSPVIMELYTIIQIKIFF